MALVKVADLARLALEIPMSTAQARQVAVGQAVAVADSQASGRVTALLPQLDASQSVLARVSLVDPQKLLRPGQAEVTGLAPGSRVAAFAVSPDPSALAARGVTYDELRAALESNTRNNGAGRVNEGEETWVVRVNGGVNSLDDLRHIGIKAAAGVAVTVGDVARVEVGELARYGAVTQDGRGEAVEGLVIGLKGVNAGELIKNVKARLAEIQAALPQGVTISTLIQIRDREINNSALILTGEKSWRERQAGQIKWHRHASCCGQRRRPMN